MSSKISPNFSFSGWNIWEFIKGRKKMIVTAIGAICGYFALNQELTGVFVGPVFEGVWAIVEYWLKQVNNKK